MSKILNSEGGTDLSQKMMFNIIDTPGHIDFTAEVKRSLKVLDGAVVVFDGVAGVEPQSETNWRYADDGKVPRICLINKLDRTGGSFERSYQSILNRLTKNAIRMQIPIGEEEKFEAVIDLLKMKAFYFEGEMGKNIVEKEIIVGLAIRCFVPDTDFSPKYLLDNIYFSLSFNTENAFKIASLYATATCLLDKTSSTFKALS
jgi:small GTP-binding protein